MGPGLRLACAGVTRRAAVCSIKLRDQHTSGCGCGMRFRDTVLAALISVIWGLAFVATKLGLESFSAAELTALRDLAAVALDVALAGAFSCAVGNVLVGWGAGIYNQHQP